MTSLALTFNEVNFSPVQHNNQIWLTASELAKALGYAKSDAVTQIYERNKDEFTSEMTTTLNMSVVRKTGSVVMENRIFNSRGCHLITFFARTSVAKQFRKWVLDVLDKEIGAPVVKTHKSEREPLTNAVNMLVSKTKHLNYSDAYKLVHQRFNVQHIDEIPYDTIPVAVEYVHHLIALYGKSDQQPNIELVRELVEDILMQNFMLKNVWLSLHALDKRAYLNAMYYVVKANVTARDVISTFNLKTKQGKDMISMDFRVINFYDGLTITGCNPNYFNAPA